MSKSHIKKGDIVYVLAGEDRGKEGRVLKVLVQKQKALVEGINMVTKATKPTHSIPREVSSRWKLPSTSPIFLSSTPNLASRPASAAVATRKVN